MLVDANLIPVVFNSGNENHKKYRPVLNWLVTGRAKLVIGGGYYYKKEIREALKSYLPVFKELSRLNKTHYVKDEIVDPLTDEIKRQESNPDFDDPHIIALLRASTAKILCSEDERSFKFVKDRKFYPKNLETPKILCLKEHSSSLDLLNDENICSNGSHEALPEHIAKKFLENLEKH
jgi:predicted nucleic acid-binding protein